ncbi:MAG: CHAT domain-containing protein [Oscillatoriophycideae cyanobacterium NC_groundwater_1537_Pr4_S-0.65um_50_18]|nr:CHAT domain-containing protein [Oscillatoriophycideae cyanobacterium NC_groundwater_1537_Pr4_S-0.65um_50_18]
MSSKKYFFRKIKELIVSLCWHLLLAIASLLLCLWLTRSPAISQPQNIMPLLGLSVSDPQNLVQQGKVLYATGRLTEAAEILQQAAQIYQKQGDTLRQAMTLSNLALVYQQSGLFAAATQAINDSLTLLEGGLLSDQETGDRSQILAQTLEIQGSLQLEQGQAELALETWRQSEALHREINDSSGTLRSQINQAQALQVLGFYRRALTLLTELSQRLHSQPDSLAKVVDLRSLGEALQFTGDLAQSRQALQTSLDLAKRLHLPQEISAALLSLGNTARVQQDISGATSFYQQAAEIAPSPLIKIQAQINQVSLLVYANQAPDKPLLSVITAELAGLPMSQATVYAAIHFAQALIKLERQEYPQAAPDVIAHLLAQAVQQSRSLGDQRAEAYALGTLGGLYERTEQWADAKNLTEQALWLADRANASDIAYRWHWQMGRLLKQQGDIAAAIVAYDAAIDELQFLRNDLVAVNREVQFSFRDSVEPVYRQSVELLLRPQMTTERQASQQNLDKARQRIEALQLAELDNFFRESCLNASTVLLDKVVDQDNPTTAILYPIILPDQLQVIAKVPGQPLRHYAVNQPQAEIERVLSQLRQSLTEPDTIAEVKALSQQLYGWLIQPTESVLEQSGIKTLVFVLDGALRSVPMAALYDSQQYLVEKYAVALSPGLQLLNPEPIAQGQLQVLAAGLVQPPLNFQHFPPLPEIQSEFNSISAAGVPITTLLDQEFTSQTLENQVNRAAFNILHLATHGQFSSRAEDTFVLAADGPINVTQFDTFLRRRDETRSPAIELLVLSACQTAAGDNRATLGLAGAAVRAGARSTLASLWNIGDRSTAILMGEFYKELATSKVTKAEALRRAQVTLLKQYPNYSRPGYWAAYVLIGNWL